MEPKQKTTKKQVGMLFALVLLITLISGTALAQVVTPPMNPTTPVSQPAATGWNTLPSAGLNYFDRIGSRSYEGENIYEFSGSGYTFITQFNMGERISFSGHYQDNKTEVDKSTYYPGEINLQTTETQANICLNHEQFAVFGLAMRTRETKDFISDSYPEEKTSQTSTSPSMSIKMGSFYFGGGVEIVKESSSFAVNNHWTNTVFALALMSEKAEGLIYRIEISSLNSPETTATAKNNLEANVHNKATTSRVNLEAQYKGLVFEAFTTDTRESVSSSDASSDTAIDEIHTVGTQFGFLIAPQKGIVLGFHFRSDKTDHLFKDNQDSFQISLAYNFGE
jgi:opacity protein-like surface antigen